MIFYQHPTPASPQRISVNEWNLRSERSAQFPGVNTKPLWKNRQLHSITVELGEWRITTDPIESAREFREEKCNYLRWKGARHCLKSPSSQICLGILNDSRIMRHGTSWLSLETKRKAKTNYIFSPWFWKYLLVFQEPVWHMLGVVTQCRTKAEQGEM